MLRNFLQIFIFCFFCLGFSQEKIGDTLLLPELVEQDFVTPNQDERIVSFKSDITIAENAEVTITETIQVYANGNNIKRGIFRALPTVRNINGRKEKIYYKILSVLRDGNREKYHENIENGIFTIYIGDKNTTLSSGYFYTYQISYKTQDQIGKFSGYDEFYWNVNGTDWSFPIENIEATLHLPPNADILQNSCYTGEEGSIATNCTSKKTSSTQIKFNADNLNQHENLTIAVGFKAGILKEPSPFSKWIKRNWMAIPLILLSFYLLFFYYENWKKYGKDPEKPVVIPQFNVPKNLSPAAIGYIDKKKFDASLVTANLIDLSVKGFIKINEVKDEKESFLSRIFILKKLGESAERLKNDQYLLLKRLFEGENSISVNGSYNSKIKSTVDDFEKMLVKENKVFAEETSNVNLVYKALKIIIIGFFVVLFLNSLMTWSFKILGMAAILSFFGGLFATVLVLIYNAKNKIAFIIVLFFSSILMMPLFLMAFSNSSELTTVESNCFKFLIFSIASLFVFRYFINNPSEEKVKMQAEIEGFKMYLSVAEENELKFHNPPAMTSEIYEKFLPYAIVFGVEGIWGKKFRNTLQETLDSQSYVDIQNQLGSGFTKSFTTVLKGTTVLPASSFSSSSSSSKSSRSSSYSGGSSSSGSSGGGRSGGGGGGGGGGGW